MRFLNDEGIKFFQFGIPGNKVRADCSMPTPLQFSDGRSSANAGALRAECICCLSSL
jgi:hypothetical protein